MRKTSNRIRDGHYYPVTIPAKEGEYGELELEYRPILAEDSEKVFDTREQGRVAYCLAVCDALAKHIHAWSEWDDETKATVPITVDNIKRLPSGLLWAAWDALFATVTKDLETETKNLIEG